MHRDHDYFIRGIEREIKLKLHYLSRRHNRDVVSLCAPLHYSKGLAAADDLGCYYLWDFEARKGSNFLALSPSEIISMELTGDAFCIQDLNSLTSPANKQV